MNNSRFVMILSMVAMALVNSACTKFYGPALHGYEMAYLPKKDFSDSTINVQIGMAGSVYSGNGYNSEDGVQAIKGTIYAAHAFRFCDLSYGFTGYSGTYHIGDSVLNAEGITDGSERFGGYAGQIGLNLAYRGENFVFRYLGFDLAFYNESGQYATFRKRIDGLGSNDNYATLGGLNGVSLAFGTEFEVLSEPLQGRIGGKASMGKAMNFSYPEENGESPSYIFNLHAFYRRKHFYALVSIQGWQQSVASLGFGYNF